MLGGHQMFEKVQRDFLKISKCHTKWPQALFTTSYVKKQSSNNVIVNRKTMYI
jgi:hypothetical protein